MKSFRRMSAANAKFTLEAAALCVLLVMAASPARCSEAPESWESATVGAKANQLAGWYKGGDAPAESGEIVEDHEKRFLRLSSPVRKVGGLMDMVRGDGVTFGSGVEAKATVLFSESDKKGADVLLTIRDAAGQGRYQLNIGPEDASLGVRPPAGGFATVARAKTHVAAPGEPVEIRFRVSSSEKGGQKLECFAGKSDQAVVSVELSPKDANPARRPIEFDGTVKLSFGVQNGCSAGFTDLDLAPLSR